MSEKRKRKNAKIVRFNDDEFEKARENAARSKMKFETYIRWIACNGEIKVFDMGAVNELALQIHRIGVNINQIAAMVNKTKTVYKNDTEKILEEMGEMKKTINRFIEKFERDNPDEKE